MSNRSNYVAEEKDESGKVGDTEPGITVTGPSHSTSVELHPLRNLVILTHLFELCPTGLLSHLRLVSREWHRLSLALWRSSFPLTIRLRDDDEIFVINNNEQEEPDHELTVKYPLHQFMEHLQNPGNDCVTKPFRQLLIQNWIFGDDPLVPQAGWNILGQGVAKLTFEACTFNGIGVVCELVRDVFPNLRSLCLNSCLFTEDPSNEDRVNGDHLNLRSLSVAEVEDGESDINWLQLLSNFPSLTGLSLLIPKNDIGNVLTALKTIKRFDRSKLPIKDLDLHPRLEISTDPVSREQFLIYRQFNLPLQSLRIRMHPSLEERVVEEMLRFHGGTLNEIIVFEDLPLPAAPRPSYWKFPFNMELEKLRILKISESLLESLQVLKYTPNLVRLDIMDGEHDIFKPIRNTETKIVSNTFKYGVGGLELKRLTIFSLYYVVSDEELSCLIKWMPNMVRMSMVLNDTQFGMVCDGWRKLANLEVLGQKLTDLGVTGMGDQGHVGAHVTGEISLPNIILLQDLWKFDCWSQKLTDASVFHGFLKLDNLKRLEFYSPCSSPEKMVLGEAAKTALLDKAISLDILCFCDDCGCA